MAQEDDSAAITKPISFRLSESERRVLKRHANAAGYKSLSAFLRFLLNREVTRVRRARARRRSQA